VLIRVDGAGATHDYVNWLVRRRLAYSVGFTLPTGAGQLIAQLPDKAWSPAYDADGQIREGAFVAELTGMLDLTRWPAGMRVVIRRKRPHPGAHCGSRTSTATGSPRSRPTPRPAAREVSCPTSSCGTAAGPAARTASATQKTPGWPTCRCTTWTRTGSGAPWSPSPAT